MGKYIIRIKDRYFEWSTISDSPATYGMLLDEFTEYYRDKYGREGMIDLVKRMERVEEYGSSAIMGMSTADIVAFNRAGENEECLTANEIYDKFVLEVE